MAFSKFIRALIVIWLHFFLFIFEKKIDTHTIINTVGPIVINTTVQWIWHSIHWIVQRWARTWLGQKIMLFYGKNEKKKRLNNMQLQWALCCLYVCRSHCLSQTLIVIATEHYVYSVSVPCVCCCFFFCNQPSTLCVVVVLILGFHMCALFTKWSRVSPSNAMNNDRSSCDAFESCLRVWLSMFCIEFVCL